MSNTKDNTVDRGNFFWRFSKKFQFAADKIIPDSFVFCLILTFIVFIVAAISTGTNPIQMTQYWYDGLWTQMAFAFQMSFMVITCAACARAPLMRRQLDKLARIVKTPASAMVLLMVFGYASSFVNWAFCTIGTPVLAMQLSKNIKGLHFPMMVAAGFSTSALGQCLGPTATVYALLATEGHFLQDKVGVLTQDVTVYNSMNVIIFIILAVLTTVLAVVARPPIHETVEYHTSFDEEDQGMEKEEKITVADKLNGSHICMWLVGAAGIMLLVSTVAAKGFFGSLSVNFIIFIFMTANCFIYNTPRSFVEAYKNNMKLGTEVMMQFPFYGGLMGMMQSSGFGQIIVGGIVSVANAQTLPLWSYISASVVNLFIPSQGGQWIVQGPILIDAALKLDADVIHVANAFVYGDEATNLLQPLYIIPALSIVGMKLKDVWGFMAFIWVFWTVITTIGLYFIPMFL